MVSLAVNDRFILSFPCLGALAGTSKQDCILFSEKKNLKFVPGFKENNAYHFIIYYSVLPLSIMFAAD